MFKNVIVSFYFNNWFEWIKIIIMFTRFSVFYFTSQNRIVYKNLIVLFMFFFFFYFTQLNFKKVCRTGCIRVGVLKKSCYIRYTVKFCSLYNTKRIYWLTFETKANRIDGAQVIFWTCSNGIYWGSSNLYLRVQHQCCQPSYLFKCYIRLQYNEYIFKLPSPCLQF